jgi:hypothetical protein
MKITDHFRGIYRIYPNLIKENRRMSTCNRLDLQILGSQPIVPKNLPDHCLQYIFNSGESSSFFNIFLSVEVTWFYFALMMEKCPLSIQKESRHAANYLELSPRGRPGGRHEIACTKMSLHKGYKTKNHLE